MKELLLANDITGILPMPGSHSRRRRSPPAR